VSLRAIVEENSMFSSEAQLIGIPSAAIDTPALVIDLEALEDNINRMGNYFATRRSNLRPHFKTHKCPILAHKQLAAGAVGMTCAKVEEAEVLVAGGILDNILIANQVVTQTKIFKLMGLNRHAEVMVCVDDSGNIAELATAAETFGVEIGVFVEVNIGMNRCGVDTAEEVLALVRQVSNSKGLRFMGLQGYEGHDVKIVDFAQRQAAARRDLQHLVEVREYVERSGIKVPLVDAGGTGTYNITGEISGIDEIQAGSYLFGDVSYLGVMDDFRPSLSVLSTVVSRPAKDRIITDMGLKAASIDQELPQPVEAPGVQVKKLSEEHCYLTVDDPAIELAVGDRIAFLPGHVCTTINLHERYYGVRNGLVEVVWEIAARGKSR
jgi:D-serine deaminase-like pyridoxal phosphate-dependent protein